MRENKKNRISTAGVALAQPFCLSAAGMAGGYPLTFSCADAGFRPASANAVGTPGSTIVRFVPKSHTGRHSGAGLGEIVRCA